MSELEEDDNVRRLEHQSKNGRLEDHPLDASNVAPEFSFVQAFPCGTKIFDSFEKSSREASHRPASPAHQSCSDFWHRANYSPHSVAGMLGSALMQQTGATRKLICIHAIPCGTKLDFELGSQSFSS